MEIAYKVYSTSFIHISDTDDQNTTPRETLKVDFNFIALEAGALSEIKQQYFGSLDGSAVCY